MKKGAFSRRWLCFGSDLEVFFRCVLFHVCLGGWGRESSDVLSTGYFHYFGSMEGPIFGEMFAMGGWVGEGGSDILTTG